MVEVGRTAADDRRKDDSDCALADEENGVVETTVLLCPSYRAEIARALTGFAAVGTYMSRAVGID